MTTVAPTTPTTSVLAVERAGGLKMEMIREADGRLAIHLNGAAATTYRWPMDQLEQCVDFFLALVRNRPAN
jgi:hypothetical protein